MSSGKINLVSDPAGYYLTLHILCEEDFPWLLLWMTKENASSLSLLLQTTRHTKEIDIVSALMNGRERISLLTFYAARFTRLRSNYALQAGDYSIQQLQLNPMINHYPELRLDLLRHYIKWLQAYRQATRICWKISSWGHRPPAGCTCRPKS